MNKEQKSQQKKLLKNGGLWDCIIFCRRVRDADFDSFGKYILSLDHLIFFDKYKFFYNIKEADIKILEDYLLEHGVGSDFSTACGIERINKELLQNHLLENGDGYSCYCFAESVKNADIKKLEKRVLQVGEPQFLYLFARHVKGSNKRKIKKRLLELDGKGGETYRMFLTFIDCYRKNFFQRVRSWFKKLVSCLREGCKNE